MASCESSRSPRLMGACARSICKTANVRKAVREFEGGKDLAALHLRARMSLQVMGCEPELIPSTAASCGSLRFLAAATTDR